MSENSSPSRKAPSEPGKSRLPPLRKYNQKEVDASSYRLSRVPQRFVLAKDAGSGSYAARYYRSNPVDDREPEVKLAEIDDKIEGAEGDELFALLVQKKTLTRIVYGVKSPEYIKTLVALGKFYNQNGRSGAAARTMREARELSKEVKVDDDTAFALAVESAEANLNAETGSVGEKQDLVAEAESMLEPYREYAGSEDLVFRRDLMFARIKVFGEDWQGAVAAYEKADGEFPAGASYEDHANLLLEAAAAAEKIPDYEKARAFLLRAKQVYEDGGNGDGASAVDGKILELDARAAAAEAEPAPEAEAQPEEEPQPEPEDAAGGEEAADRPDEVEEPSGAAEGEGEKGDEAPPADTAGRPLGLTGLQTFGDQIADHVSGRAGGAGSEPAAEGEVEEPAGGPGGVVQVDGDEAAA